MAKYISQSNFDSYIFENDRPKNISLEFMRQKPKHYLRCDAIVRPNSNTFSSFVIDHMEPISNYSTTCYILFPSNANKNSH